MTAREAQQRLDQAFHRAREASPDQLAERDYLIGRTRTRLRAVGADLACALDDAFFHLRLEPGCPDPPELCIDVWDASATGVPCPVAIGPPGLDRKAGDPSCPPRFHGDAARAFDDGVVATADDDRHVMFERGPDVTWLDRRARRVVACRGCAETLPLIERAKPFTPLLSTWLSDRGVHTVHAALVAAEGKGALVAGGSGVGKTTCALLCLEAGFAYLGDDFVAVEPEPTGGFTGHSLYASSRIHADDLERFGWLALNAIPGRSPAEPKALILLRHLPNAALLPHVPLRVILIPRIARTSTTRARRAVKADVFRALISSSLLMRVPSLGRRGVDLLAALVDRVPAYHLELGHNLKEIPLRIRDLLDEAGS